MLVCFITIGAHVQLNHLMMISGDISAEELFNMFFGAGFQTGNYCTAFSPFMLTLSLFYIVILHKDCYSDLSFDLEMMLP